MTDYIERQAAIDAMCEACSDWCDEGVCKKVSAIQRLTSAQPELIEQGAYVRGFEQGRTQGMIDAQGEKDE